ncbi:hypothetical protein [Terrabacter sp. BE26]|uniref:hypothetical protein n=1 Tax=Terrabacter sp. BE26 TaxID=2898152 RepID=UPI0035BE36C1
MAKQRAVDRSRLGAWLLKCNPALWDLRGLLDSGEDRITSWAVQPGYRAGLVAAGDPVVFWVSGPGREGLSRGVWGLGHATAEVEPWVESGRGRWRSASDAHGVRARVELDVRLLGEPVRDEELRAAGIDALEVQRQPFMANPSFVSREELAVLRRLLPAWPAPSPTDSGREDLA